MSNGREGHVAGRIIFRILSLNQPLLNERMNPFGLDCLMVK